MIITPKNWAEFQHYKDRSPPWIKLHKGLLDDWEFQCLPVASRALAPMLWLLASESANGEIDANSKKLAFRLRMTEREVNDALKPLIDGGFFVCNEDASGVIAGCKPDAMPETEKRQSREEADTRFAAFWVAYPKKASKGQAERAFKAIKPNEQLLAEILQGIERAKTSDKWRKDGGQFIPHPATWLNAKGWEDEITPAAGVTVDFAAQRAKAEIERTRQMLDQKLGPQLRAMP